MSHKIGLGETRALLNVYIANRPNFAEIANTNQLTPCVQGEIDVINQACGNGWRKVFNVYAKLAYALNDDKIIPLFGTKSWQEYRDKYLLQAGSRTNLLFSSPSISTQARAVDDFREIHLIMGKGYAKKLLAASNLKWIDTDFAIDPTIDVIVCPYFDYRQLSNIKIVRTVELIKELLRK